MRSLRVILLALVVVLPLTSYAQVQDDMSRHYDIDEVYISGARSIKDIGVKETKLDTMALKESISLSMADILTFNAPIFIKSYGRATLSTVSFRGTSPSHTHVSWNGMKINKKLL